MTLTLLLRCAGVLHGGILLASALTPGVMDWRIKLRPLPALLRQLVWVHGAFIFLIILGFGTITVLAAGELAAGTPLARLLCAFIALFWLARLSLQFLLFDPGPLLSNWFLKLGYHGLTVVFTFLVVVYALGAFF